MRGFLRVLRAETKKLVRRRVGYLALGIGLIAAVATVGLVGVQAQVLALQGEKAQQALNGFEVLSNATKHGLGAAAMPLLVLASFLLSEELELGTAKILYSKPVRRLEVVLAKGVLLLGCALLIAVIVGAVTALCIHLRLGFHNVVSQTADPAFPYLHHTIGPEACPTDGLTYCMPRHSLIAFGLTLVPLGALLLLGLMLSACTHQSGASVGLAIGAVLCMLAVGSVVPRVEPYLVTTWFFYPEDTLHQLAQGLSVEGFLHRKALPVVKRGLWVSSLTGLAAWAVAALVTWRRQILLVLGLLLPALLLGQSASAKSLDVRITQHRVHGQVWGMQILDVDADGRADLVVLVVRGAQGPRPERDLAIFYQHPDGRFARSPDQVIGVPADAVARIVADLDPKAKGLEIAWLTPRGIRTLHLKDHRFLPTPGWLVEESSLFDLANGAALPGWDSGAQDVDGDGLTDLLLLRKGDCVLYRQQIGGGFRKTARFPLQYKQRFGPRIESIFLRRFLSFHGELGRPVLADCDGDGTLDVVTLRDNTLEVYLQKGKGEFPREPSRRSPLGALLKEGEEDALNQLDARIVDVDGDKRSDLVLSRNLGRIGVFESLRTQVLYVPARPGWDLRRPKQIINLNGVSMSPALIDIDNDGDRDLALSSLRTDLISNIGTALFSEVTITYYVYLYDQSLGRFSQTPDFSRDIEIAVDRVEGGGTIPLAYLWGDYTGDKRKDLLTLDKQDVVSVYPMQLTDGELDFPEGGRIELRVRTSNSSKIQDINWDGTHDLVFWYWDPNWERVETGVFTVVMSK